MTLGGAFLFKSPHFPNLPLISPPNFTPSKKKKKLTECSFCCSYMHKCGATYWSMTNVPGPIFFPQLGWGLRSFSFRSAGALTELILCRCYEDTHSCQSIGAVASRVQKPLFCFGPLDWQLLWSFCSLFHDVLGEQA